MNYIGKSSELANREDKLKNKILKLYFEGAKLNDIILKCECNHYKVVKIIRDWKRIVPLIEKIKILYFGYSMEVSEISSKLKIFCAKIEDAIEEIIDENTLCAKYYEINKNEQKGYHPWIMEICNNFMESKKI